VADLTIAQVRPDLMGTYGDRGNGLVLVRRVQWRGGTAKLVDVEAHRPLPDETNIIVIGGAEDAAQRLLIRDQVLRASLIEHITSGTTVLAVCAGLQLLGHDEPTEGALPGLGLLDIRSQRLHERAVGEILVEGPPGIGVLSGFENHRYGSILGASVTPLGAVCRGVGNSTATRSDGAIFGNIVGTYLHGPVLARNPALADHLLSTQLGPLEPLADVEVTKLRRHLIGPHV
jgi:CobQ-like glutamine amidotransferase family enzyme